MSASSLRPVTELLLKWKDGDQEALDLLLPLVYAELRRLAQCHLKGERSGHTLQSTALVHEAYLRLVGQTPAPVHDRAQFFAVASRLMREILVDHARRRQAAKRDYRCTIALDDAVMSAQPKEFELLALDEALRELGKFDPQQARIVELRFFSGLSIEDTSTVLKVSPATVKRDWTTARAWLHREMSPAA